METIIKAVMTLHPWSSSVQKYISVLSWRGQADFWWSIKKHYIHEHQINSREKQEHFAQAVSDFTKASYKKIVQVFFWESLSSTLQCLCQCASTCASVTQIGTRQQARCSWHQSGAADFWIISGFFLLVDGPQQPASRNQQTTIKQPVATSCQPVTRKQKTANS